MFEVSAVRNVQEDRFGFSEDGAVLSSETSVYTGCPRRNVPNFGRVFLMLNYTDITQNTYIQS